VTRPPASPRFGSQKIQGEIDTRILLHEVRNGLNGFLLNALLAERGLRKFLDQFEANPAAANPDLLRQSLKAVEKIPLDVDGFINLMDGLNLNKAPSDLNETIQQVLMQLQLNAPPTTRFEFQPTPQAQGILCDPAKIQQVLTNLVKNAVEATGPHGVINIRVSCDEAKNLFQIHVVDNGPGVSQALHPKLFQRDFTTKGDNGNGIGLYISRKIMQAHGGHLTCTPGDVGHFTLTLPLRAAPDKNTSPR
jgi:signal transduction histidine kinase